MRNRLTDIAQAFAARLRGRRATQQTTRDSAAIDPVGDLAYDYAASGAAASPTSPIRLALPGSLLRYSLVAGAALLAAMVLVRHPPMQAVPEGQLGVRINQLTGGSSHERAGAAWVLPGLHRLVLLPLGEQTYRSAALRRADGVGSVQSSEGLAIGADIALRYAIDPARAFAIAQAGSGVSELLLEPALQGAAHPLFARYTVREIFSGKRADIQKELERDLKARLAADGILLRGVQIGKIDLPADYRRGVEALLAEELAGEKMRYTIELKAKQVKEAELMAASEKVQRELRAEAAAREQIIAAKGQEEAMKHVLPFKQRQVEQRQLEAEAERVARLKIAQGSAEARRIEAAGEADARLKLAEAEATRQDKLGKVGAEQMAREGALLTRHPLLIQKTLADKLSDKVQVIIAAPPSDGGFIGSALLGLNGRSAAPAPSQTVADAAADAGTDTTATATTTAKAKE